MIPTPETSEPMTRPRIPRLYLVLGAVRFDNEGTCPYLSGMASDTPCNCLAVRQVARQVTQLYDAALADTGLRVTQYSVLSVLDRLGASTLQALAAELVMDRSTLGHNLRPLERDGLVTLGVDDEDRRSSRLTLTAAGKRKLESSRKAWLEAQRQFETNLGAADAKELRRLLQRAVTSLST